MPRCRVARPRGFILLYVLATLTLLAAMSVAFVNFQGLDRRVALSFTDGVRARMLAQSGVEHAIDLIRSDPRVRGAERPDRYWGDVDDETGAPHPRVPLEQATNPSFAVEADAKPQSVVIEGRRRGLSMVMSAGTYGRRADIAAIRAVPTQGQLFINDGVHEDGAPYRPVTQNLRRMLNVLGSLPGVGVRDAGDRIVQQRPPGGWRSVRDLRAIFGPAEFDALRPFVTTHAWVDANVCLPVPLSADPAVLGEYPPHLRPALLDPAGQLWRGSSALTRRGRNKDWRGRPIPTPLRFAPPASASDPAVRIYGTDELNPTWIQITRRAPVSVNDAPREVLVALLSDLRGFFVMEGRRASPDTLHGDRWGMRGAYRWMLTHHTSSPEPAIVPGPTTLDEGDEIGRLYATLPLRPTPASDPAAHVSAYAVADEIIACRARVASGRLDYSKAWFGGPLRTWRQFNAFCDALVEAGVLADRRSIFEDGASPLAQRTASRALADVLKANFNPNLHLNELNPDENLFTLVDKTDLIVQSTEFWLGPSPNYEIESLGRVLGPVGGTDALTAPNNRVMAQRTARAVVSFFEPVRQTTQRQFAAGTFGERSGSQPATHNGKSVEAGPEVGPGADENGWDGYVALPTVGGSGGVLFSESPEERLGSSLHGHFDADDRLHHHIDGPARCADLSNHELSGEGVENFAAPGESAPRPYMPSARHRLARDFEVGREPPALSARAPVDLRLDGIYSERHSAPAWWLSRAVWPDPVRGGRVRLNGAAAYWIKPSFFPESSGKTRVFLNASLSPHQAMPFGWMHLFAPAHDAPPLARSNTEDALPLYLKPIAPSSFLFGFNQGGVATGSLNHEDHAHDAAPRSVLAAHRWVHVVLRWKELSAARTRWDIYVNGALAGSYTQRPLAHAMRTDATPKRIGWSRRCDGTQSSLRLGSPSRAQADPTLGYVRPGYTDLTTAPVAPEIAHRLEHAADATFDEFYVWGFPTAEPVDGAVEQALSLWQQGRYAVPDGDEGVFTSGPLPLTDATARVLPPPSPAQAPPGAGPSRRLPAPAGPRRIVGMSWTLLGEATDAQGRAVVYDYAGDPPTPRVARVEMSWVVDGRPVATGSDDGWTDFGGSAVVAGSEVRYRAQFRIEGVSPDTILLATPVLDDVTLLVSSGPRLIDAEME
jgi:hypothetical protein